MEFKYRKYKSEDREQVIKLMEGFWNIPDEEKLKYFKWKFEDNPYTESPYCYVALDGEKIIAFRGNLVIPVKYQDKQFLTTLFCDAITHPNYRRLGLINKLSEFTLKDLLEDSRFLVSQNSSSGGPTVKAYYKIGHKPLSEREHIFRFTLNGIIGKFLRQKKSFKTGIFNFKNNKIEISNQCKSKEIASIPFETDKISHIHVPEFYEWRLSNPKSIYRYAYFYDFNGKLIAYLIFLDMGGNRFDLIDFNCYDPIDLKLLLNQFCKIEKPLFILLWTVGKENVIYKNFRKFGFIPLNKILRKIPKFLKPPYVVKKLNSVENLDFYNSKSWNLFKIIADEV